MPRLNWTSPRPVHGFLVAGAVVALDRVTKWLIETRVSAFDRIRVIPNFFDIVHSENRGVAFGLFNDSTSPWRTALLVAFSLTALGVIGAMLLRPAKLTPRSFWGLSLIFGGAAGNLFDRAAMGRVTDFLEFYVGSYVWPSFNVADSAIVIGAGLMILDMLKDRR